VYYVTVTDYTRTILWRSAFHGDASRSAARRKQAVAGIMDDAKGDAEDDAK
jgi:hypothetical protein